MLMLFVLLVPIFASSYYCLVKCTRESQFTVTGM